MTKARRTSRDVQLPTLSFPDIGAWERWLARHHSASPGIWLSVARKSPSASALTYPQALETALTYGWIDGQRRRGDSLAYLVKFTPRGPRSAWSRINREKGLALIRAGRMKPAGLRAITQARQDGRWSGAYAPQSRAAVPPDLEAELARHPRAGAFFERLDSKNRYAILYRLQTAKLPATRARRLAKFVAMLRRGERIHEL